MLCHFCSIFTEYILDSKLGDVDRWRPVNGPDYELSIASVARPQISEAGEYLRPCCFTHYPHFSELEESATEGCQICALILNSLGAQKCLNYRRSGWPVRLCLLPISHGDQSIKRFRICIGKTTSPLTQTLLELEYYQRCERSPTSKHLLALDPYQGYEISHSASSNACVQLALNWFDTCSRFHQKRCGLTSSSLPTRVLDVGKSNELGDVDTIQLIATDEQQAPYVVLSHCWGPREDAARVKTTTTESLDAHLVGILVEELPRSFQDAIVVTRNLNIRYLWIDSLCIVQDLASDWEEEAGKMGDYYERAAITISALCSPSSHTGFLRNRWLSNSRLDFRLENYENINIRKASSPFGSEVGNKVPLWKRAWVVQERCLSSRILHFGSEQMYWECRQCFVHEDGRRLIRSSDGARMGPGCFLPTGNKLVEKSYVRWYQLIAAYSKRALSVEDDRLPALGGIVVRFQKLIKSEYLAGIWKDDIIRGLLWCRKNDGPHRRVSQQRKKHLAQKIEIASSQRGFNSSRKLPSWSWAAIGSPVVWTPMLAAGRLSTDCNVIEARVTPQGPIHLGRVTEASIQLCGFLMQSSLMAFTTHLGPHGQLTKFENNPIYTSMDGVGSDIIEAHFLYMANDTRTYYWLTLTQCTSGDQLLYKRVGILYANKAEHGHLLKDAEQTLVTIV